MNPARTTIRLTLLVLALSGINTRVTVHAQQSSPPQAAEQAFLDAIKKGNSAKVGELLKQNPALIKARTKKGTTPVMLAMFNRHKEIAEFLATGRDQHF